jgi:hypothetical protein
MVSCFYAQDGQAVSEGNLLSRTILWMTFTPLVVLLALTGGCRLLAAPVLMWGKEPTKEVPAAYPYLRDKKVSVLVWADSETLFEYPWVQLEVSEHVAAAMQPNVSGISFVPNRQVVELQRREPDWDRSDPAVLGAQVGADRVLMIELTQYTTREPESPHLYRGRIAANVKVYDTAYRNSAPVFKAAVETVYPPESAGQWGTDDVGIRKATMEAFALDLAGKFYDRRVKVK